LAGITSQYRIGPSDFFTPGDLRADANTLNDQINRLNDQNWDKPTEGLFEAFQGFLSEWRAFYSQGFGLFTALNDANRDQLVQFETRFQAFVTQYEQQANIDVPDVVAPSSGAQDTLGAQIRNQLQPLIPSVNLTYALIAVAVVGLVLYFFWPLIMRKRGAL